jgi:hypothetical protein
MSQIVFTLPQQSTSQRARRYIQQGFTAHENCKGRGANPYPSFSLREGWWDSGWCEAELIDLPEPARTEMERWLAGGND